MKCFKCGAKYRLAWYIFTYQPSYALICRECHSHLNLDPKFALRTYFLSGSIFMGLLFIGAFLGIKTQSPVIILLSCLLGIIMPCVYYVRAINKWAIKHPDGYSETDHNNFVS